MPSLEHILSISCRLCGVTPEEVRSRKRTAKCNIARGLYLVFAARYGYRIIEYSSFIERTHASCTVTRQHYEGYLCVKDKNMLNLYDLMLNKIETNDYE